VIQRLFATGLSLQAVARTVEDPSSADRIMRAVDELDVSIRQIRSTIFELQHQRAASTDLRREILETCEESATVLGFEASCEIDGPVDSAVVDPTRRHLLLCLRESLSNVARHAGATQAGVSVTVRDGRVALTVTDDGVGYVPAVLRPSSGLDNMRVRAESVGGRFAIAAGAEGGTVVTWDVPLH
jgi:signal transduction histidine kinase